MKRIFIAILALMPILHCAAEENDQVVVFTSSGDSVVYSATSAVAIDGLNYLLDSTDKTAIVSTQPTTLSGTITIPSSVTYSGSSYSVTALAAKAFQGCNRITSVSIPSSITSLSNECFSNCSGLKSITIPTSVTSLGSYCFWSCDCLTSITIPTSVTSMGRSCFSQCSGLTSATINANVSSLPTSSFQNCTKLQRVSIPTSVTSLGEYCFLRCTSLSSIILPSALKTLDYECFSGCSDLTEITLPASVTEISIDCFADCSALSKLTCNATTPPTVSSNAFTGTLYQYGTLLVPSSAVSAYQAATTWKDWKYIEAIANAENIVSLSDATTPQNTSTAISVKLKNDSEITNFQFDVYLPAGVTMATSGDQYVYAKGSRTGSSHSLTCALQSDGAYRFICYSAANALLSGNDGEIMNFTVQVPSTTATGDYTITIKNAKVAEPSGKKYVTSETSSKLTVTQGAGAIKGITLSSSMTIGQTLRLTATVAPSDATTQDVTWESSNTDVATVDADGLVTAVAEGSATITCSATDGSGISVTCSITVDPAPEDQDAIKCDINGDGQVTIADVTYIVNYILRKQQK